MDKRPSDFDGKLVYIASPYAGDVAYNIKFARAACRYCIEKGNVPIAVHLLYPQILDDTDSEQRQTGLKLGHCILKKCDDYAEEIVIPKNKRQIYETPSTLNFLTS